MNAKTQRAVSRLLIFLLSFASATVTVNAQTDNGDGPKLQNPINVAYVKKNLRKAQPRLVFNRDIEKRLRQQLKTDSVIQNMYKAIQRDAAAIPSEPLLERKKIGRRLLSVSREMLRRVNMLGMVYRIEKDPAVLQRINDEVLAVCRFSDWNPSHYLDVGEMALAVALALDWTAGDLPKTTIEEAEKALIEKGIKPSWPANGENPWWAYGNNNWNQVCNGGMIAASIAIAERDPELAAKTLHRALDGLPNALHEYMPSGVYPEGSTYWDYGTGFSVITIAMLESAFGTDFGYGDFPGFLESATFRVLTKAPSGMYYNFADCGDRRGQNGDIVLAWFAKRTGNAAYFEQDRFLQPVDDMGRLSRLGGAGLVWLAQFEKEAAGSTPTAWQGGGSNPVVFFTGGADDPHQYYFGGKGGRGTVNHGNMDGGSFVFELNGVRWVIDPGNQSYEALEKTGFELWGKSQNSQRWTLLTKNNFGHSTLTVNGQMHRVDGMAAVTDFKDGAAPEATIDLSAAFGDLLGSAQRRFVKDGTTSLLIEDKISPSEKTEEVTWQLMTTADVVIQPDGALLTKDGKSLRIENLSHPGLRFSVVSLDPAPLALDRQIKGLKRIELRIPRWTMKHASETIRIRLVGE
ncbi:heparinase II/III domain-containing protein [Parapedobacter sp. 10938]|uniref:heparinase II/III domain-containing protein n=1 Tax=Parapedobacter flavus TaxID=3110225 RepID=UPI002DBFF7CA|nr:heparinase II/III family protein [Parapedobacter sp. 10938]MEC3879965.1 heparinase II/III family protein [Parapedobacter sp. 10938]